MLRALWEELSTSFFNEDGDEVMIRLNHLAYNGLHRKAPNMECLYTDWHSYLAAYSYFPISSRAVAGGTNPDSLEIDCIENLLLHYFLTVRTYFDPHWPPIADVRRPALTPSQTKTLAELAKQRPQLVKGVLKHIPVEELENLVRRENQKLRQLIIQANQVTGAFSKIKGQDWSLQSVTNQPFEALPEIHQQIIRLSTEVDEVAAENQDSLARYLVTDLQVEGDDQRVPLGLQPTQARTPK